MGRTNELSRLRELVGRLPEMGRGLVVMGEAGIGKTALLDTEAEHAAALGKRVVKVTAIELEATLPYSAMQQILHALPGRLGAMRARPRSVLERAAGMIDGEAPDGLAVGVALLEALTDEAPDVGLLLIVDDAHWLDGSTARALAFAARRLDRDPALVLFAVRSGHASPALDSGFEVIELGPLPESQALDLLRLCRPSLNDVERQRVLHSADGNPLALLELAADHDDGTAPLASRLRSAFVERMRGVTAATSALLLAAALDDGDAVNDLQAAAVALGFYTDSFRTALQEFSSTRTIDVRGARFSFRHPLIRSAIVSTADDATKRRTHAALAVAVADDAARAIWHQAGSTVDPDEQLASRLEVATEGMERRGIAAICVRAWETVVCLSENPSERARRTIRMAESALRAGLPDAALDALRRVDRSAVSDVQRARWSAVRLSVDPHTAGPSELTVLVEDARRLVGGGEIDLAVSLALTIGENLDARGDDTDEDFVDLAEQIAAALPAGDIRGLVVLAASDRGTHGDEITRAMLALDADEFSENVELLTRLPVDVDADVAIARVQRRLLETCRERGQLRAIASLQAAHAWVEIALANWPEALRATEEGIRLASEIGVPRWGTGTLIGTAFIAAVHGDHVAAEEMIHEAERGAISAGANNVLTSIQLTKGVNYLAQGRYDDAFAAFRRPFDPFDPSHHPIQTGWILGDLAEAAAHLGRLDEVRHLFDHDIEAPTSSWQRMAELYATPFLAEGARDVDRAFQNTLTGVVRNWPVYRVRMLIEYGSWLRRQRRSHEARDRLREARDLADALSVHPWLERAQRELRAIGAESAPVAARAWELLSAQELEVAQLAAQGFSNREIGERLFLSHRTVGSHLYHIFPKLGIANRAQLAVVLRPTGRLASGGG